MLIQVAGKPVWLNYHHLYYFKVIATEGSIARAADKLKLGQPTLSAQLKQFEDVLGVPLFERRHKRLVLNETGRVVQEYANEIFRLGAEMVEVVHDKLPAKRVHVQIGALDSVPKHLTLALTRAAMKHGNCMVSILEGKADELIRELVNHKIDLFVSNFVPTQMQNQGLFSRRIVQAPVVVCGAARFKGLRKGFPQSLEHAPFILPTADGKLRHDIDHFFRLSGIHIDVIAETQDTAIQKLMSMEGLGLVPMPVPAVQEHLKRDELIEIGRLPGVSEELYLISASRKIANPVSSELMRSFKL